MLIRIHFLVLMVLIYQDHILLVAANRDIKFCKMDKECASYTYQTVKPFLTHFRKIYVELLSSENKDKEIQDMKMKLAQQEYDLNQYQNKIRDKETEHQNEISVKEETIMYLKSQINFNQKTIESLITQSKSLNNNNQELKTCALQLETLTISLNKNNEETQILKDKFKIKLNDLQKMQTQTEESLKLCQLEVSHINETKETNILNSCMSFKQYSGVHKISLYGLGPIDVLCDSQTVGDKYGWIVIQQRINGGENFDRNWTTYRNGFGSFEGDFFMGLEKLHRLTKGRQQQLYIHMKRFDGTIDYARYDNFKVGSEEEDYKLSSLGEFSSNGVRDVMGFQERKKFTTYERDNVQLIGICPIERYGGWWHKECAFGNLNGEYSNVLISGHKTISWTDFEALKEVKMLVRPKLN